MSEDTLIPVTIALSLLIFALSWLSVGFIITRFTAWGDLVERYSDKATARSLGTFRLQGAYVGREKLGASYRGCLTFTATNRGLRNAIWKIFAPFVPPILIGWDEIETQHAKAMMFDMVRLRVGRRGSIWITIAPSLARGIERVSDGQFALPTSGE